jgi:hypothetical protein
MLEIAIVSAATAVSAAAFSAALATAFGAIDAADAVADYSIINVNIYNG